MKLLLAKCLALGAVMTLPNIAVAEDAALIVVESNYARLPDQAGANTAAALAQSLDAAGFRVTSSFDQGAEDAWSAVERFRDEAAGADRVFVFLAGHMVSTPRESWLLTRQADAPTDLSVGGMALPLGPVLDIADGHPGQAVVMLVSADNGVAGPGLAPGVAVTAPQGVTLVTGPFAGVMRVANEVVLVPGAQPASALDRAPRGVVASGFLSDALPFLPAVSDAAPVEVTIAEPSEADTENELGLSRDDRAGIQRGLALLGYDPHGIDGIFGKATRAALSDWQQEQGYAVTGYLTREELDALTAAAADRAAKLEAEAAARKVEDERKDTDYWRETGRGSDEAGLRAYLNRYPDGLFAEIAGQRLAEIEAVKRDTAAAEERDFWDKVRAEDQADSYRSYLDRYPNGAFAKEAQARLTELTAAADQSGAIAGAKAEEAGVAGNVITRLLVENQLKGAGFDPGRIDGSFDEASRRAIRRFQQAQGLEVTGYVTQATMVRLMLGR